MRKPDHSKEDRILKSLRDHPEGAYVSEIARETGITKSTVSFLLSGRMKDKAVIAKEGKSGVFKIYKLRK